jgi:hypothetical protein
MKSLQELERYFQTEMQIELEALDARRKVILKKWTRVGFFVLFTMLLSVLVLNNVNFAQSVEPQIKYFITCVIILILGGAAGYFYARDKTFLSDFKFQVIEKIIKFINPDLTYEPRNYISSEVFRKSRIFLKSVDRYNGDDLVHGQIDKTQIKFSEIKAEYKTTSSGKSGQKTEWHTIFQGMFFVADFNKHFQTSTIVLPNILGRGFIADFFRKMNFARSEKLVKLEDPRFNKHFVVYGEDQIEARYVLSTSLMSRITEFKEKYSNHLYLSFVDSQLYVAISFTKNLFEPNYFQKLTDFKTVREYFDDLHLVISIVEELNLNNRIWTKQ